MSFEHLKFNSTCLHVSSGLLWTLYETSLSALYILRKHLQWNLYLHSPYWGTSIFRYSGTSLSALHTAVFRYSGTSIWTPVTCVFRMPYLVPNHMISPLIEDIQAIVLAQVRWLWQSFIFPSKSSSSVCLQLHSSQRGSVRWQSYDHSLHAGAISPVYTGPWCHWQQQRRTATSLCGNVWGIK